MGLRINIMGSATDVVTSMEDERMMANTEDDYFFTSSLPAPTKASEPVETCYIELKEKQSQVGFLELQEDYIRDDQKNLKCELVHAKAEILRIRSVPTVIGQFLEMIDENHGIASSTAGSNYYVRVLSTLSRYTSETFFFFFKKLYLIPTLRTFSGSCSNRLVLLLYTAILMQS